MVHYNMGYLNSIRGIEWSIADMNVVYFSTPSKFYWVVTHALYSTSFPIPLIPMTYHDYAPLAPYETSYKLILHYI